MTPEKSLWTYPRENIVYAFPLKANGWLLYLVKHTSVLPVRYILHLYNNFFHLLEAFLKLSKTLKPLTCQGQFKGELEPISVWLYVEDAFTFTTVLCPGHKIHFQVYIRKSLHKIFSGAVFLVNGHLLRFGHPLPCNRMDEICLSVVALVRVVPGMLHYNFSGILDPWHYRDDWHRLDFQRNSGVLYRFYRSAVTSLRLFALKTPELLLLTLWEDSFTHFQQFLWKT